MSTLQVLVAIAQTLKPYLIEVVRSIGSTDKIQTILCDTRL